MHLFGHLHEQRGLWKKGPHGFEGGIEYRKRPNAAPFVTSGPPPANYPCEIVSCNAMQNHQDEQRARCIAGPGRLILVKPRSLPSPSSSTEAHVGALGRVQPRSLPSPSSSTEVCIFNTRHGKQLSTPNGSDVQVQERQARDNTAWRILPCPHEPGTSYIIDLKQQKFLDTPQGEGVSLWNNGGRDIEMIIDQNTSRFARNLRWHITACPHEPGTFYIINAGYGKFLDTNGEKVWLWNNNGKSVDTVVAENTSRFAGNLRWILRPVQ